MMGRWAVVGAFVLLLWGAEAHAQGFTEQAARDLCMRQVRMDYGAQSFDALQSSYRKHADRWDIEGTARRNRQTSYFDCSASRGRIRSINFVGWSGGSPGGSGGSASPPEKAAKQLCKQAMQRDYGAQGFYGLTASYRSHASRWDIRGYAQRGNRTRQFSCSVRGQRIESLAFEGWNSGNYSGQQVSSNGVDGSSAAVGVVAGAIIAGAIIAAAGNDDHEHQRTDYDHRDYRRQDDKDLRGWSPADGIICLSSSRMCYDNGEYSAYWTKREFH